jgi:hypothetical protein
MRKYPSQFAFLFVSLMVGVGCSFEHKSDSSSLSPTPTSTAATFAGVWASTAIGVPDPNSCTNFQWTVTDVNGTVVSGQFSATCAGGLTVQGTGSGSVSGTSLAWTATGTATQDGVQCPFNLSGTAVKQANDALQVQYAGSVCGIPVSGTQVLNKK